MAARDYLVAKGKDARDIRIVAKGETEPVKHCKGGSTDATKACLAPNRRVLIAPE
jgi:outer membrane protein OmpA-like peptidoglycan-associated protein